MPRIISVILGCLLAVSTVTVEGRHANRITHHDLQTVVASVSTSTVTHGSVFVDTPPHPSPPRPTSRSLIRPSLRHTVHRGTAPTPHATAHLLARSASVGAVPAIWEALAGCESSHHWHDNTGNGFYGGLQITAGNAADYGFARPDLLSPVQQVRLARLILRDQGVNAWPVCGPRVGLQRGD